MQYELCTTDELKRFARDRKIKVPKSKTRSRIRSLIIAHLERADRKPTFARFTDLPSELRARVFSFDFLHHEHPTVPLIESLKPLPVTLENLPIHDTVKLPPVTRANRLLRSEALPQYYSEHRFAITSTLQERWQERHGAAWEFSKLATPDTIAMLRRLKFVVRSGWHILAWDVDLPVGEKKGAVKRLRAELRILPGKPLTLSSVEDAAARVEKRLTRCLARMTEWREPRPDFIDISYMAHIVAGR